MSKVQLFLLLLVHSKSTVSSICSSKSNRVCHQQLSHSRPEPRWARLHERLAVAFLLVSKKRPGAPKLGMPPAPDQLCPSHSEDLGSTASFSQFSHPRLLPNQSPAIQWSAYLPTPLLSPAHLGGPLWYNSSLCLYVNITWPRSPSDKSHSTWASQIFLPAWRVKRATSSGL